MIKTELRRRDVADGSALSASERSPLLCRLYAARGISSPEQLDRGARGLLNYRQLNGIEQGVALLKEALHQNLHIVIVGDFDADGATSTALSVRALRLMGFRRIDFLVPNRFEDGYGLSPQVVEEARKKGAELIMTVDYGMSSHDCVYAAQAAGIRVIVEAPHQSLIHI